jgi:hypothetical protein
VFGSVPRFIIRRITEDGAGTVGVSRPMRSVSNRNEAQSVSTNADRFVKVKSDYHSK